MAMTEDELKIAVGQLKGRLRTRFLSSRYAVQVWRAMKGIRTLLGLAN